ncbi:MAG: alcohol dehydrogenase catalytic domain-containing protein [Dehalococcoidia bacterium]|nr:alcohol dehydrogenase catalytic domain-containing protein [Dehalococcoidia bacterium]
MKALALYPGKPNSLHIENIPNPTLADVPDGNGVLVEMLAVGGCGTDLDINAGEYGRAPRGSDFLVIGHENLGRVIETGPRVPVDFAPGTLVVAMVRRPGRSIYDLIGRQDLTTDDEYHERGISLLHGFASERYVDSADFVVPLPGNLRGVGVLLEPMSVCEKGIEQAYTIQRRLQVWRPQRAAVLGAGPIGMLSALALRLRGLEVTCYSKRRAPSPKSALLGDIDVRYVSSGERSFAEVATAHGPFDLILEATGFSPLAFEAAEALGPNGVLILASLTSGERTAETRTDAINQGFVLGNKVMVGTVNASRDHFIRGVDDMVKAEAVYPGWLARLLTTRVSGLESYERFISELSENKDAIMVFIDLDPG